MNTPPKVCLGDYRLLKKCTVLFVSCLACAAPPALAEHTLNLPLAPIQQRLLEQPEDHCALFELRSQPVGEALNALYQAKGYTAIWQDEARMTLLQAELSELLDDGLNPLEYLVPAPADADPVCAELHYSALYLQALEHLSRGRLDQQRHEPVWQSPSVLAPVRLSVAQLGIAGLENLTAGFASARPTLPLYQKLRSAYQQMDADLPELEAFPAGPLIRPESTDARLPLLARRLMLTGYLDPAASAGPLDRPVLAEPDMLHLQPLTYHDILQRAVRAFQADHGLQPDAVIGPQTVTALNFSPRQRQQQVRINLERLRWLDARRQHHSLIVNAAGGVAILHEGDSTRWTSRVQSGTADRATPLLDSRVNRVTLNPSWTIPPTIMREDKLPQIRANPAYFAERNLLVLNHDGTQLDPAAIDWQNPGGVMLREPPGPGNPLGRMVFRFDNPFSVFLHDTPSQALFERAVRNVSSGCVRVQRADELADYLFYTLDSQQRQRIRQRMDSGTTHEIRIDNAPQVLLTYWTAQGLDNGKLRFTPDPYQLDAPLIRAYHQATGL